MSTGAIYLLRHGEIAQANPRKFIGRTDLSLTDRGKKQIDRTAEFLTGKNICRIICSPLTRCRQSAEILDKHLQLGVEIDEKFTEIDLGSWEGLTVNEVQKQFAGQYEARGKDIVHFKPQNGESFQDLSDRVWPAFSSLDLSDGKRIAIVAHSGVNRVLLCRLLGMPLSHLFRFDQSYGCCNTILSRKGEYYLASLNYT